MIDFYGELPKNVLQLSPNIYLNYCNHYERFRGMQLAWEKPENMQTRHNMLPGWSPYPGKYSGIHEPCYEKTGFLHMQKQKTQISFAVTTKLFSAFIFTA